MSRGGDRPPRSASRYSVGGRELRDLAVAWVVLGVAFAIFLDRRVVFSLFSSPSPDALGAVGIAIGRSLLTVGSGFLLHELAHKVVAVRFGQVAEFRADYGMLGFALLAALGGFLFAAPGAVYHRGRITERENGLIALAGPVTNLALALGFLPVALWGGTLATVGNLGVLVNVVLAGFNMLPAGPLDGRKIIAWNPLVYAAVAGPSIGISIWLLFL